MSRLTLLYGEAGSGKTTLLKSGVLPLLRRRAIDHALARQRKSEVVIPFPDRRASGKPSGRGTEVVIFLDAWSGAPLATLRIKIHESLARGGVGTASVSLPLANSLAAWNKLLGVRFLIIFDGFENYLDAPLDREGIREFGDEFVQAVNQPFLPANFLVSLRDDAEPLLEPFRSRIPGFGDDSLRLPSLHHAAPLPLVLQQEPDSPQLAIKAVLPPADAEWPVEFRKAYASASISESASDSEMPAPPDGPAAAPPVKAPTIAANPDPIETEAPTPATIENAAPATVENRGPAKAHDEVQTAVKVLSAEIAALAHLEPWNEPVRKPAPAILVHPPAIDVANSVSLLSASGSKLLWALPWMIAILVTVTLLALVMWPSWQPPDKSFMAQFPGQAMTPERPVHETTSVAPPSASAHALARFEIVTDAANGTDSRIARELARLVARAAGIDLDVLTSKAWAESLSGLNDSAAPRLAIVAYDALQAARQGSAETSNAANPLRIVMPLYTEEIYFLVRADSPLKFIHEIQSSRINIGPAQGSRALTATRLHERMFGTRIPVTEASFLGEEAALTELVDTKTIDVMVLVAGQPAALLAYMAPSRARAIKLLKLDRNDPSSRKALQSFLPASVRAANYRNWLAQDTATLAVMSFLVTADSADPATAERLGALAQSLCRNLPALQRAGHPKWREVQPGLQLDVGWPYSPAVEAAFRSCLAGPPAANAAVPRTILNRP